MRRKDGESMWMRDRMREGIGKRMGKRIGERIGGKCNSNSDDLIGTKL